MGIIIFSGVLSLGYIWVVNRIARSQALGMGGAFWFALVAAIFPFAFCLSPALALQSVLTAVLVLACVVFRRKPSALLPASLVAMLASYTFFLWNGYSEIQNRSQLRSEFPLTSVAERLHYETGTKNRIATSVQASQEAELSPAVEGRLSKNETGIFGSGTNIRRYYLSLLHDHTKDEFVMARGFGVIRMAGRGDVRAAAIELPGSRLIPLVPQPEPQYEPDQGALEPLA